MWADGNKGLVMLYQEPSWSASSSAHGVIRRDLAKAAILLRGMAPGFIHDGGADLVVGFREFNLMIQSQEVREYIMESGDRINPAGVMFTLYGFNIYINWDQPIGDVDLIYEDKIVTLSPVE